MASGPDFRGVAYASSGVVFTISIGIMSLTGSRCPLALAATGGGAGSEVPRYASMVTGAGRAGAPSGGQPVRGRAAGRSALWLPAVRGIPPRMESLVRSS